VRWAVEVDTESGLVSWPKEADDIRNALAADLEAENAECFVDPAVGAVFARFAVDADEQHDAVDAARRIMVDALERAGLRLSDEPLAHVAATPSPVRRT
jgi:hypothetical protein